jgi:hypothetical protein
MWLLFEEKSIFDYWNLVTIGFGYSSSNPDIFDHWTLQTV